jgi:hypothetical protein
MSEYIKSSIKKNRPHFLKFKKYILENDWRDLDWSGEGKPKTYVEIRKAEFDIQNSLVKTMIGRLKRFVQKSGNDYKLKIAKTFIKDALSVIDVHIERAEDYTYSSKLEEIKTTDLRAHEVAFHQHLYNEVSSIDDQITALNIQDNDDNQTDGIEFLNNIKAPLAMYDVIIRIYPEVQDKINKMKINLDEEPGDSFHIYTKNPPVWDKTKHFWLQEPKTFDYYWKELKKIKNGLIVDGYYISGWMYYHMNFFMTPIPVTKINKYSGTEESSDVIMNPPLRDSEIILFENYENAKRDKKMFMFVAASRRIAKTTLESSKIGHAILAGKREILCAGSSTKDLNQITKNFKIDIQNKTEAFIVFNVANDWKDKIEIGLKTKSNKTILLSTVHIVNTDSGNNAEVLAGYTIDEFLYDEALKSKFINVLQGLKPALKGKDGAIRTVGLLTGTGGDDALSADGHTVLSDPIGNDVLPMNWELLERGIAPEHITWDEDKLKPFGTFIPGQMCVDMPKIESNLADYVGIKSEKLSCVKLKVTDWGKALEMIEINRKKVEGNKIASIKEIVYMPTKPSEIFMSGKINRFPVAEAKAHKRYLLETGLWDRRRDLYRDFDGKIKTMISDKPLAEFPHKGGVIDAPFLIFEDLPTERPKYGTYTGGFDDYASEDSNSASLSTFSVKKNTIVGDPFSDKIVASIAFRPEKHSMVWEKWLLLMEAYNLDQTAFGENFNYEIKTFLDRKQLADKYLAPSVAFTERFTLPNNGKRTTGWNPQTLKKFLFDNFVEELNKEHNIEQEDGSIKVLKGVQLIDDIGLLEEIIQWSENLNVDRITSAMGCYGYAHYLRSSYKWKPQFYKGELQPKPQLPKEQIQKKPMFFNPNKKTFFRGLR